MDLDTFIERAERNRKIFDFLVRHGEIKSRFPFFFDDIALADNYGYQGKPLVYLGVEFKKPIWLDNMSEASKKFLGKDFYIEIKNKAKPNEFGDTEKMVLVIDDKIGEAAKNKNYDAIITGFEIQVLDSSVLPEPEEIEFDDGAGNYKFKSNGEPWTVGIGYEYLYNRKYGSGDLKERFQKLANIK